MSDIKDVLSTILTEAFTELSTRVAEEAVTVRTKDQTVEERLRFLEVRAELDNARIFAIEQVTPRMLNDIQEQTDAADNVLMSVVFALAGHVLGRTFSADEIDSITTAGVQAAQDAGDGENWTPLGAGQFVANALRDFILAKGL